MLLDRYAAFPGLDRPKPSSFGPLYEIRTYRLRPGELLPTLDAWAEAQPKRSEVSPLTLAMYALNTLCSRRVLNPW